MNNLSSYCGLTESRMRVFDTDLPVPDLAHENLANILSGHGIGINIHGNRNGYSYFMYRESSPYANFITVFFQKFPEIFA